jgi:SHS2 domain-containing protein
VSFSRSSRSRIYHSLENDYNLSMPYEEIPHTADLCLRVWATDLSDLFMDSAFGMNALTGIRLAEKPRVMRSFTISATDIESLLVSFLSELAYYIEKDHLAFDLFDLCLTIEDDHPACLCAEMEGAAIVNMERTIKAVTFNNLQIHKTTQGYEFEIVFDV